MLTLAFPAALGLLAALALVGFLYFLRLRFRRQNVSSTLLWRALVQTNEGGARWRWRSVSLLVLQVLAVTVLVLALAGLEWVKTTTALPGTVYLLDASASMGAKEDGSTRFAKAVSALRADAAALSAGTPVAVFLVGDRTAASSLDALGAARPGFGAFDEAEAAQTLSVWVQTHPGPWSAVVVSDGGLSLGASALAPVFGGRFRTLDVATDAVNLGIVDARLGSFPLPGVRVTWFNSGRPATVAVVLAHEGRPVSRWNQAVGQGTTSVTTVAEVGTPPTPGVWTLSLENYSDAFDADNRYAVSVSPPRRAQVLLVGPSVPFLKAALAGAQVTQGSEADLVKPWDLVVATGGELPPAWQGNLITFGPLPSGAPVFWGPEVSGQVKAAPAAPSLGRWVPWSEVRATSGRGLIVSAGAAVLASVGSWPVAATWESGGYLSMASGVDLLGSNLGLTAALPIVVRNFVQSVVPQLDNALADNLSVGRAVERAGTKDWKVVASTASGGPAALEAIRRGGLWTLTARQAGAFTWTDGAASGTLVAHVPASESDLSPRQLPAAAQAEVPAVGPRYETFSLVGWLALVVLALLAAEWWLWNGGFSTRANPALLGLRLGAAAAAVLAAAGLSLLLPTQDRTLVLTFDVSDSLGPALVETERESALSLVEALAPSDRVALVAFARTAHVVSGLLPRDQAKAALKEASLDAGDGGGATNVREALAVGGGLLEGEPGKRAQYLFTDGRANSGGGLDSLSAGSQRWPVSVVPVGRTLSGVSGQTLDLPPSARPNEAVTARWTGWTDKEATVEAVLSVDGQRVEARNVVLKVGANDLTFAWEAGSPGSRRVEVTVGGSTTAGLLTVDGPAAVLLIRSAGGPNPLASALTAQGFVVVTRGPAGLPAQAAEYRDWAAVILDNVSATDLEPPALVSLKDWVASGGGLLVVGGESSLGRGEYFDTALEDLLPVHTDARRRLQFTRSRILFVVDHSGSMTEEVGGITKLQAAINGVAQSLPVLSPQDEVGLLEFDTVATWLLPFTPLSEKAKVAQALKTFTEGGGTDLTKALEEVITAFGHPGPIKRHVILLTDGQTGGEKPFFADFSRQMKAAQVSLTVLGVGKEVNDALLGSLAHDTDGQYYHVEGDQVPAVLHKETVRVTRDLIQEGSFLPRAVGSDPVQDLGTAAPEVRGYLVTRPKPTARILFEVERSGGRDPLVADTRYGAGRVAVVTADSGVRWLAPWVGRPVYNRFWGQLVSSLETGPRDKNLRVDFAVSASMARVTVEALDGAGGLRTGASLAADLDGRTVDLVETAPGRYEAELALAQPGLQVVTVRDRVGTAHTSSWAWNPPSAESSRGGTDWAGLGRLASVTGGLLEPLARPQPPPPAWAWSMTDLRGWWLLAALAVFLVELTVRSTSLGQLALARSQFLAWWAEQAKPWNRTPVAFPARSSQDDEKRTRDAYRALAQRKNRPGA